jgi:hypothetical protein
MKKFIQCFFSISSLIFLETTVGEPVLRGQVRVDLEPVYAPYVDVPYPLDTKTAQLRALEEAALNFGAIIYGWSFDYDIGEKVRNFQEHLELSNQGLIPFGDPKLIATDAHVEGNYLCVWFDYRPDEAQIRWLSQWDAGIKPIVQGLGVGPLAGPIDEPQNWRMGKQQALEDAARAAIRSYLRSVERNRPKQCTGFVALDAFPRYYIDAGRWTCVARFKLEITEIIPFSAY